MGSFVFGFDGTEQTADRKPTTALQCDQLEAREVPAAVAMNLGGTAWRWTDFEGWRQLANAQASELDVADNAVVVGSGAVYVWVKSSSPDVDLQATISEVRPDGNETFVQSGWMRASELRRRAYVHGIDMPAAAWRAFAAAPPSQHVLAAALREIGVADPRAGSLMENSNVTRMRRPCYVLRCAGCLVTTPSHRRSFSRPGPALAWPTVAATSPSRS